MRVNLQQQVWRKVFDQHLLSTMKLANTGTNIKITKEKYIIDI